MKSYLFFLVFVFFIPFIVAAGDTGDDLKQNNEVRYECENDLIEVLFHDDSRVRLRSGVLIDLATNALQGVDQALSDLTWHTWTRISDVPEETIDQWQMNGEMNTGMSVYNLNNIYRLRIPEGYDVWELSYTLNALPGIIHARPVPRPQPAPVPPNYQSFQGYLNPASSTPTGIDAQYAWTQTGGTGTGITVCDLEYSWNYNHADITKAVGSQINTNVQDPFNDNNHGTAVIGELVSDNNSWGTTGICYGSGLKTCGTYYGIPATWNVPGAMAVAIANLNAGDVILLEQQWDYNGSAGYVPIEWWTNSYPNAQTNNGVYAAIVNAVANGIHVVEAGGNGSMNTDLMTWYGNSGAIIVGAGGATTTNDLQRLSFSSYGSRFDLQGWGENVFTTGYGYYYSLEGVNYYYTSSFSGTSSASPIVAGAVACASGYWLSNISGTPPSPAYMRSHLATYGTAQVTPPSGNIGPRPDLYRAITNFSPQQNLDWGDAPDPPYPTLSSNSGANHIITVGANICLGSTVDPETNGQPNSTATGDDNDGNNDDDGVTFTSPLRPGQTANVAVVATVQGILNAWIDFNGNGLWTDPGDQIFINQNLNAGSNALTFSVPSTAIIGNTFSRFRFSTSGNIPFYGQAPDGEVEDYMVWIDEPFDEFDWGDAPDGPYPTLAANNGANHLIDYVTYLGNQVDAEPDGQPDPQALGDDNDILYPPPNDDEDGVTFTSPIIAGQTATVDVIASVPGRLNAWIDFNLNGSWADAGDQIFTNKSLVAGLNSLSFAVPTNSAPGQSFARFRFNLNGGLTFTGIAYDGEVEDYMVWIDEPFDEFDWGDAPDGPYPTLAANNGANHLIDYVTYLGNQVDAEPDGQPDPQALGDDNDILYPPPNDDEDGVTFTSPIIAGQTATVDVIASVPGRLNAWIDFNLNGSWADAGDQIFTNKSLVAGLNSLSFAVPTNSAPGQSFARFRFNLNGGLTFTGIAYDGEVEDYEVFIDEGGETIDWGDAPDAPYPTVAASNGANHKIDNITYLGNSVDGEPDGQPDPNALGDDLDILFPPVNDDEDGVTFNTALIPGQAVTITVVASVQGYLNAWIDFNFNGTWADAGEQIYTDLLLSPGSNVLNFTVPASSGFGQTFARFRFASFQGLTFTGSADDGEVEDYEVYIIEEQPEDSDWGDAPDSPYPTLSFNNGASHVVDGVTYLGAGVDIEPDGQPDANALGDDNDIFYPPPVDDEDGVAFMQPLILGQSVSVNVVASVNGFLNTWIDFNMNGSWADAGEQVFIDAPLVAGVNTLTFTVPAGGPLGQSFARFRFSTAQGLPFFGPAPDGEVEDYEVLIEQEYPGDFEYGDAPEGSLGYPSLGVMGAFPTCRNVLINGYIQHNNFGAWLGPQFDMEPEGNAGNCPLFNPNMYNMDECFNDGDAGLLFPDGFTITGPAGGEIVAPCAGAGNLPLGAPCTNAVWGGNIDIDIHNHMPSGSIGYMNVLIDWNQDGVWAGSSNCPVAATPEHVLVDFQVPNPFDGPISALLPPGFLIGPNTGYFWARFSITEMPVGSGWDGSGIFEDGESEDYLIFVTSSSNEDWGDAPDPSYPTLAVNSGASHILDGVTWLGAGVDADPDGQPDPNALGDDNDGNDDEDGIVFGTSLAPGATVTLQATASVSGLLNAWIDFNANGTWADPGEQIFTDATLTAGTNTLTFNVPISGVAAGNTFARFRFSTMNGLTFTGQAPDGEVEDYEVYIEEIDMGDADDPTYPTLLVSNGAAHIIDTITFLGAGVDAEFDGQPDPNALGDDNDGNDDEDGVSVFSPLIPGSSAAFDVTASGTGFLNVWIDFNANGSWAEANEHVLADVTLSSGSNLLFFTVPSSAIVGTTYARFRFSTVQGLSYTGLAPDGEVEDHEVYIEAELDFGDAPDPTYPTLFANNGARHIIDYTIYLGNSIDPEGNGQQDPNALGDDNDGNDDEDGVILPAMLVPGQSANITVTASANGFFNGWIDFNADGDWADANEQVFADYTLAAGSNNLTFTVPASAMLGQTFARFRYCTLQGLTYTGQAPDGEVEDYEVTIDLPYKWKQEPDLSDMGMDVDATWDMNNLYPPHILADDFYCDITGPLTNITIWGSWYHDHIPFMSDPNGVVFTLSIHKDIPDSISPTGYSMPGDVIWWRTFNPGEFTSFLYASNLMEGWYDPVQPYYEPNGDTQCWMYSFDLNPDEFIQEGTSDVPMVYWLDVQAQPMDPDPECRFGWKTSVDHWNDDAVWGVGQEPYPGPWNELFHPVTGESLDMAFAIMGAENPYILVDLTVFLEGPYNTTTGAMDTDLNNAGVIPVMQPYSSDPTAVWYYSGAEIVSSMPSANVTDWVMVELRDASTPGGATGGTMIGQKAAFLLSDGSVVALDGSSMLKYYVMVANNLYAVVYHRNHLGVMSNYALVPVGNTYTYDFSTAAAQAYGSTNAHKDLGGGVWGMIGGDGKPDGEVNNGDKNDVWALEAGSSGYKAGDFNMDVQVNNGDKIDIWIPNVGRGSQIP